jgi:hypothetical protein
VVHGNPFLTLGCKGVPAGWFVVTVSEQAATLLSFINASTTGSTAFLKSSNLKTRGVGVGGSEVALAAGTIGVAAAGADGVEVDAAAGVAAADGAVAAWVTKDEGSDGLTTDPQAASKHNSGTASAMSKRKRNIVTLTSASKLPCANLPVRQCRRDQQERQAWISISYRTRVI